MCYRAACRYICLTGQTVLNHYSLPYLLIYSYFWVPSLFWVWSANASELPAEMAGHWHKRSWCQQLEEAGVQGLANWVSQTRCWRGSHPIAGFNSDQPAGRRGLNYPSQCFSKCCFCSRGCQKKKKEMSALRCACVYLLGTSAQPCSRLDLGTQNRSSLAAFGLEKRKPSRSRRPAGLATSDKMEVEFQVWSFGK